jgi:hypothetical protein
MSSCDIYIIAMKCCNCNTDIPPEWKHAINNNSCPACGGALMNEAMQELLAEIRAALEAMPNDPEGLAGWLLSHYELRKFGSGEPVQKFFGARGKGDISEIDPENIQLKAGNSSVQKFFKQAGIKVPPKRKPSELVESINSDEEYVEQDYESDEYVSKAVQIMNQGGLDPGLIKKLKNQGNVENEVDVSEDLHPALQFERIERLKKQQDLQIGGSVGKIRRSE